MCAKISQTRYVAAYRCRQQFDQTVSYRLEMCSTSVINFKTGKTHVLIVPDVIDHFVLIEKTAKRKNTEDDKTSSLDPRKK